MCSSAAHVIRLRGPWQYRPIARTVLLPDGGTWEEPGELPPPGRILMPADWGESLGAGFRGRVLYTRRFGRPSGLEPHERVELVLEQLDAFGQVALNQRLLGKIAAGAGLTRFDVTSLLRPRNELAVEVELPRLDSGAAPPPRCGRDHLPGGLVGEVRLEIHC